MTPPKVPGFATAATPAPQELPKTPDAPVAPDAARIAMKRMGKRRERRVGAEFFTVPVHSTWSGLRQFRRRPADGVRGAVGRGLQ